MSRCEVVAVSNLADAVWYPCTKASSHQCWDCGIAICDDHSGTCSICRQMFCPGCLSFHGAIHPQACRSRARAASRTQNSVKTGVKSLPCRDWNSVTTYAETKPWRGQTSRGKSELSGSATAANFRRTNASGSGGVKRKTDRSERAE